MTLGERIRTLRKERKMTLQQLAGDAITKGMLSLIENNKAKPSMESLQHIATMLEVPISDLLEESSEDKKDLVKEVEELYSPLDFPDQETLEKIHKLITPHLSSLSKGYLDARLLDLYSRVSYELQHADWKVYSDKAIRIYEENQITRRMISLKLFGILTFFRERNYQLALDLFLEERKKLDESTAWSDPFTRLDLEYTEAIFYYAVGLEEEALETMHAAIEFSKSQKIFYRLDHLYRLAAVRAVMTKDKESMEHYVKRLEAYADFTDDQETQQFIAFLWVHHYTTFEPDFEKAEQLLQNLMESMGEKKDFQYENVELAKIAYHKGNIEQALTLLEENEIPSYISHPIDISIYSERDYYLAKIYAERGDHAKALALVEDSWRVLETFFETPYQLQMKELRDELLSK